MSRHKQRRIRWIVTIIIILVGSIAACRCPHRDAYDEQTLRPLTRIDSAEVDEAVAFAGGGGGEPLDSNQIHIKGKVTTGEITVYVYDPASGMQARRTSEDVLYFDDYEEDTLVFKQTYCAGETIDAWIVSRRKPGTIYCSSEVIVTCPTNMDIDAVFTYGEQGTAYGWERFLSSPFGDWLRRLLHIQKEEHELI